MFRFSIKSSSLRLNNLYTVPVLLNELLHLKLNQSTHFRERPTFDILKLLMTPKLPGHFFILGWVFFVLKSLLGIARKWSSEEFAILTLSLEFKYYEPQAAQAQCEVTHIVSY